MKLVPLSQAFNRRDLVPLDQGSEREARFDALTVHQHCAGAALAKAAALL